VPKQIERTVTGDSLLAAEIAQQPLLWPTTLDRIISAAHLPQLEDRPVILTGAGTSAYAAAAIAEGWPGALAIATTDLLLQSAEEIVMAMPGFPKDGLLVSLARSGDSPESIGVIERVKKLFPAVEHLAIVCNADGRLARVPGSICLDSRTNDRSLAMTASFSNLVLAGLCLLHRSQIADVLPGICNRVLNLLPELHAAAQEIAQTCKDRIVFLASGMHALMQESSIKVVELTAGRVMPLPESFLGLRHGPLSFARADTPIVCFTSSDRSKRPYEADLLTDLRSRGLGQLAVIGGESEWPHDWQVEACAPDLPDILRTPFEVIFSQLLAYHLSVHSGVDPDNPSPAGVVTRVVRPFRLHDNS
jgi:tagatose-6-phosphate ketose/aldose isomerase